jgi:hypothetical protein
MVVNSSIQLVAAAVGEVARRGSLKGATPVFGMQQQHAERFFVQMVQTIEREEKGYLVRGKNM